MSQSEFPVITFNLLKAREKSPKQVAIGSVFAGAKSLSHSLRAAISIAWWL